MDEPPGGLVAHERDRASEMSLAGPFRTQPYVERSAERCFCDAAMVRRCRCCRRPRCGEHVARGLCDRCGQALDRRRGGLSAVAWTLGGVAGAIAALAMLVAHSTSAVVVGLAVASVVGVVAHRALLARTIKQLRPMLATTVGELPLPERNFEEFPAAPRPSAGTSAGARLM
ncbi:MAG: hypothetical protein IPH44_35040 [Myxococcales bacterium]|nr:hypothetical protein [Myxococcales bacterium]MBK7194650.1 hypothetical protein [Myxococcales bacterium]MBP6842246.1 hypothetical protein [Kofleriaceae bacterium]